MLSGGLEEESVFAHMLDADSQSMSCIGNGAGSAIEFAVFKAGRGCTGTSDFSVRL